MRKKRLSKKTLYEKAWKYAEKAQYEAIKRRDKVCQVHENCKEKVLQVDHFLSRTHKATFFDERNLLLVCRKANWEKFIGRGNSGYRIGKKVEEKWGIEVIGDMERASRFPKKWSIEELENIAFNYNNMYLENKSK